MRQQMAAAVNHKQQSAHRSDLKIKQRRLDQNFPADTVVVTDLIGLGWIVDFGWEQDSGVDGSDLKIGRWTYFLTHMIGHI